MAAESVFSIGASVLGTLGLFGGGGGCGGFCEINRAIQRARAEQAKRDAPKPPIVPIPPPADVPTASLPSAGVRSVGARVRPEFLALSRALVEGDLPGLPGSGPRRRIGSLFPVLREIIKIIPKRKVIPKRPAKVKTGPKAPEKPAEKLPPRDPRFGKDRPAIRRGRIIRQPGEQPTPRGPRPGVAVPVGPPAPVAKAGTIESVEVIPDIVTLPQPPIKAPARLPAPAPSILPKIALGFIALTALGTVAGLSKARSRSRDRAPALARDPASQPQPQPQPPPPFADPSPPFANQFSNLATLQGSSANLQRRLRDCKSQAQRCEKRRRKNRKTCWEGFYREFSSRTSFNKWTQVDCVTRRIIQEN